MKNKTFIVGKDALRSRPPCEKPILRGGPGTLAQKSWALPLRGEFPLHHWARCSVTVWTGAVWVGTLLSSNTMTHSDSTFGVEEARL